MFSFFTKKNKIEQTLQLNITTDIHSHILPGIDDGSQNIEESLNLVKGIVALGIKQTVATPHVIGDMYRNTPESIDAALQKLQIACKEASIDISISAAAEYMIDDNFFNLVKNKSKLLTIHNNIILTEQSYASPSQYLNEVAFELSTEGFKPIMAHPERYFFYHNDYDKFRYLKDLGFLLQVNLLSLTGYYGKNVTKAAKYILDNNLADFVGTDMHHNRHLASLNDKKNVQLLNKYLDKKQYNSFNH